MSTTTSSPAVIKLDEAFMPDARRLFQIARRARRDAEYHVAVVQLADNALHDFLEESTGQELPDQSYQFDAEKGYIIPRVEKSVSSSSSSGSEPISIAERRAARKK